MKKPKKKKKIWKYIKRALNLLISLALSITKKISNVTHAIRRLNYIKGKIKDPPPKKSTKGINESVRRKLGLSSLTTHHRKVPLTDNKDPAFTQTPEMDGSMIQ